MIYNREESEVTVLGEVEKHSVSIDAKNINHIVTILSSNLYSFPMTSFLRETVSNAIDSHVEAGVNEPIIITRTKDDISIRDFGTGISPERFENIYLNIGSSTKRESNDYIGSFGIGRFSCLSVSKLANITSFYNGKAYYYVMNMDIDQLHIDKIYELDTTEHNGVEVKIPIEAFDARELDCLSFIENVYVECNDNRNEYAIGEFNKRRIHTFNNFKTITYESRRGNGKTEILLGKIPYAVDYIGLWDPDDKWHRSWETAMKSIYPCVNIGDVDITPNREALIYSDKTKECLRKVYESCILELTAKWNEKCNEEFDDFFAWASVLTMWRLNTLDLEGTSIELSEHLPFNAKFVGHPEWDKIDPKEKKGLVQRLMNFSLETLGTYNGGTIYKGRRDSFISIRSLFDRWAFDKFSKARYNDRMILVFPSQVGFSSKYFKDFLGFKYPNKSFIFLRRQRITPHELKSFISRIFGATMITNSLYCHFVVSLLKECYRLIAKVSVYDDVINSAEYQKYKKEHRDPKSYVSKHTDKITFTITGTNRSYSEKANLTLDEVVRYCRKEYGKGRIVYSALDSPFITAFNAMRYPNLIILSAAKNNMKYLEEGLPEWVRPIEELYKPDNRVLIKYKTALFLSKQPDVSYTSYPVMPEDICRRIEAIAEFISKYDSERYDARYGAVDTHAVLDVIPEGVYDPYMIGEFNELKPYLNLSFKIWDKVSEVRGDAPLKYFLLMKAKKLRPCYRYYSQMRNYVNNILNSL